MTDTVIIELIRNGAGVMMALLLLMAVWRAPLIIHSIKTLVDQILDAAKAGSDRVEMANESLVEAVKMLQDISKDLRASKETSERKLTSLEARMTEMERLIAEKDRRIVELERKLAEVEGQLASMTLDRDRLARDKTALETEVHELRREVDQLREKLETKQNKARKPAARKKGRNEKAA